MALGPQGGFSGVALIQESFQTLGEAPPLSAPPQGARLAFRGQRQIGDYWCWAAVTASLLDTRSPDNEPHRQCEIVQKAIDAERYPAGAEHQDAVGLGKCARDGTVACIQRTIYASCAFGICHPSCDREGDLHAALRCENLLALDVIDIGTPLMIAGAPALLPEDGRPISGDLNVAEVERFLRAGYHVVVRFVRGEDRHFVVITGIWSFGSDVLLELFDPAGDVAEIAGDMEQDVSWLEPTGEGRVDLRGAIDHYGCPKNILLARCGMAAGGR